ncbi:probable glycosyltransferase At3g07620 [Populus alba]|uniref:probable glycosyltransferase At3g07620 n=1 Tax=Populus alba TaxID=43335 RepID=UPI00158DCF30|nr:probable glycosyltransferase At3g07620 [Populus alba]
MDIKVAGGPQLDGDTAVAIYGCVPVILSEHYDLPFKDVLDWHKLAVILEENVIFDPWGTNSKNMKHCIPTQSSFAFDPFKFSMLINSVSPRRYAYRNNFFPNRFGAVDKSPNVVILLDISLDNLLLMRYMKYQNDLRDFAWWDSIRISVFSVKWTSFNVIHCFDKVLARSLKENATDPEIFSELFHTPDSFKKDYKEMEKNFKIFVYPHNTDKHSTACNKPTVLGCFRSEGYFYHNLNHSRFLTKDPEKAHLFFIPIYCHSMSPEEKSKKERAIAVQDFVKFLISKYPYWNRTVGADHFYVSCSEVDVAATARIADRLKNSIGLMCSPSYNSKYVPHKDVSLPQSVQPYAYTEARNIEKNRTMLGFWSGVEDSYIREQLYLTWEYDSELYIEARDWPTSIEQGHWQAREDFYNSKFCICPGGPQLDGFIAFAIHYGCIPVILSDYYDLPFNDILDWRKFSVILKENDVYSLKKILQDIPKQTYESLQNHTFMVQKHFQWNLSPVKYDAFHMVMYDLWLRHHVTKYRC